MKNVQINNIPFLIGLGVFIVCLVVRLVGIGWGLSSETRIYSFHPDEDFIQQSAQAVKPFQGKLTPGFYNYGTLYLSILSVSSDIVDTYSGASSEELKAKTPSVRRNRMLAGRVINCLAGALAALAVFLAVSRHTHWLGGILGAAAMGLTPGMVVHSRFQTVDVLATCFLAWCFYHLSRMVPKEGDELDLMVLQRAAIWSGIFAGLSAGTKYTGILAFLAIGTTLFLVLGKDRLKEVAKLKVIAFLAMIAVFFLVTPGALLDNAKFMQDFRYELTHTSTGHGLVFAGTAPGWIYHISNLVIGYGGVLLVFSLAGLGMGTLRKQAWVIGPLVFAVLVYILIGRAEVKFLRYTFPLIPVLAIGFGWLIGQAHQNGSTKSKAIVAFGIVALGGFGGGLVSTTIMSKWMMEPDVRDLMAEFVSKNVPDGSSVGIVQDPWYYTPTFYPQVQGGPAQFGGEPNIQRRLDLMKQVTEVDLIRYTPEDVHARQDWDIRLIEETKPDFIIYSSFETEGLDRMLAYGGKPEYEVQLKQFEEFMLALKDNYERIDYITPDGSKKIPWLGFDSRFFTGGVHDLMYIRPEIWICIRKDLITGSSGTSTPLNSSEEPASTPSVPTPGTSSEQPSSSVGEGE